MVLLWKSFVAPQYRAAITADDARQGMPPLVPLPAEGAVAASYVRRVPDSERNRSERNVAYARAVAAAGAGGTQRPDHPWAYHRARIDKHVGDHAQITSIIGAYLQDFAQFGITADKMAAKFAMLCFDLDRHPPGTVPISRQVQENRPCGGGRQFDGGAYPERLPLYYALLTPVNTRLSPLRLRMSVSFPELAPDPAQVAAASRQDATCQRAGAHPQVQRLRGIPRCSEGRTSSGIKREVVDNSIAGRKPLRAWSTWPPRATSRRARPSRGRATEKC